MIYGQIATATGYTFPQIDALTWGEVFMLWEYWAEHPPLHLSVAAFFGYKPKEKKSKQKQTMDQPSLANLAKMFGGVQKGRPR